MKKALAGGLGERLQDNVLILSPQNSSPYILQVSFDKVKAEVMLHHLAERGIYVSSGSACASRKDTRSHVVKAMHVPEKWQGGVIRFSFSGTTTENEMESALEAVVSIYPGIRAK
jgi:cysteine desulfurase